MKKIIIGVLAISILTISALAVPNQLTYSGRLLQNGALVNSTLTMTFKIYKDPTSVLAADLLWSAGNISVPVNQGIYSIALDQVSPNVFRGDNAYLEVVIDPLGTPETLSPRTKINSVGYALQAASLTGLSNVMPSSGNVGIGTTSPSSVLHVVNAVPGNLVPGMFMDRVSTNCEAGMWWGTNGSAQVFLGQDNVTDNSLSMWTVPAGFVQYWNYTNGNVGIGTITPANKLEASASISGLPATSGTGANGIFRIYS
ncbi:MAG: hypothetical protein WC838_04535, partial [Candidatus Margulisiibacteriota bacterium]